MEPVECHDPTDEILEVVWLLNEEDREVTVDSILSRKVHGYFDASMVEKLIEEGYLRKEGEKYRFTDKGEERGRSVIRRHRLAERLLVDVLNMREIGIEDDACRFEHILSPEVTDHICTLLGHPRKCPHGKDIPPGECCIRARESVSTAVVKLTKLRSGERGRILYISTTNHQRLDRLTSMGLFPGRVIKVHQREPMFIVFLDENQIALERNVADDIYVLKSFE